MPYIVQYDRPMAFKHRTSFAYPLHTCNIKCVVILIENLELDITFSVQKKSEIGEWNSLKNIVTIDSISCLQPAT